jgi:hypothetical protein
MRAISWAVEELVASQVGLRPLVLLAVRVCAWGNAGCCVLTTLMGKTRSEWLCFNEVKKTPYAEAVSVRLWLSISGRTACTIMKFATEVVLQTLSSVQSFMKIGSLTASLFEFLRVLSSFTTDLPQIRRKSSAGIAVGRVWVPWKSARGRQCLCFGISELTFRPCFVKRDNWISSKWQLVAFCETGDLHVCRETVCMTDMLTVKNCLVIVCTASRIIHWQACHWRGSQCMCVRCTVNLKHIAVTVRSTQFRPSLWKEVIPLRACTVRQFATLDEIQRTGTFERKEDKNGIHIHGTEPERAPRMVFRRSGRWTVTGMGG